MRSIVYVGLAALACSMSVSADAGQLRTAAVRTSQTGESFADRYDEPTGLWLTTGVDAATGTLVSEVRGTDFVVRKRLNPAKHLIIDVTAGKNALRLTVARSIIEVKSGQRTVRVDPTRATEAEYHEVKQALAESRVVPRLRAHAAGLSEETRQSPEGLGFLLTDAIVGVLDGDTGAITRLEEQVRSRMMGVGVVAARRQAIGECFQQFQVEVVAAYYDTAECAAVLAYEPWEPFCGLVWALRVEAAWFEFLGCSAGSILRIH